MFPKCDNDGQKNESLNSLVKCETKNEILIIIRLKTHMIDIVLHKSNK